MIWTGIGISLSAPSTALAVTAAAYVQLKGKVTSGGDVDLSGLLPGGSRMALIGKKS
ncbi:hypothetical protein C8J36_102570 [Rhizobium sp. PP-F2F-G48]|nr:hypothetical protein C8J36_102570 [Rhizobium sp. PP-F2F-G48]